LPSSIGELTLTFDWDFLGVFLLSQEPWAQSTVRLLKLNEGCDRLRKLTIAFFSEKLIDQPEKLSGFADSFIDVRTWCMKKDISLDFTFEPGDLVELDYEVGRFLLTHLISATRRIDSSGNTLRYTSIPFHYNTNQLSLQIQKSTPSARIHASEKMSETNRHPEPNAVPRRFQILVYTFIMLSYADRYTSRGRLRLSLIFFDGRREGPWPHRRS